MKRFFILIVSIAALLITTTANAQSRFAVSHLGNTSVYPDWNAAFTAAASGDTMYLPGGNFNVGTVLIDKQLEIIGAGHVPDSTTATYETILQGTLKFITGSSNSVISGIYLTGNFYIGSSPTNSNVTNITIKRNNVVDIFLMYNEGAGSLASLITIKENFIRGSIAGGNAQSVLVENNLINQQIRHFNGNLLVKNNTFLGGLGCDAVMCANIYNSIFQNNAIMVYGGCANSTIASSVTSCIFEKNVFNANLTWPYNNNQGIGNYMSVPFANFFVNETNYIIDYVSDYHLQNPTTYPGTDGTQVGIFGTSTPFKVGSLPINPHIQFKSIAPATNNMGLLNVNIKVRAQSN